MVTNNRAFIWQLSFRENLSDTKVHKNARTSTTFFSGPHYVDIFFKVSKSWQNYAKMCLCAQMYPNIRKTYDSVTYKDKDQSKPGKAGIKIESSSIIGKKTFFDYFTEFDQKIKEVFTIKVFIFFVDYNLDSTTLK